MAKNKLSVKSIIVFVLVGLVLWYLWQSDAKPRTSMYQMGSSPIDSSAATSAPPMVNGGGEGVAGVDIDDVGDYAPADLSAGSINLGIGCSMNSGTGLASSLMPREVASQEDYGQFAPNDILKGQNFLDPRQ